jgi:preprotein translocase subunit SecA
VGEHLREVADERLEAREAEVGEEAWSQVERFVLLRTIDSLWVDHLTEIDDMRRGIGLRGYAQQDPLNEFRREAYRMYEELRDLIRHGVASTIFRVTVQRQEPPEAALATSLAQGAAALAGSGGNGRGTARAALAGATAGATAGASIAAGGGSAGSVPPTGNGIPVVPSMSAGSAVRNVRASLGDEPVASSSGNGSGAAGGARPGYTPTGDRIGRNDPCWCGSGAKYKKCHGR